MRLFVWVILFLLFFNVSAVNPDEALHDYVLHAANFDRVYVQGDLTVDLKVSNDSTGYILVRCSRKDYGSLERRCADNTLYIGQPATSGKTIGRITIFVPRSLNQISLNGNGRISVSGQIVNDSPTSLIITGKGQLKISGIESPAISMSVTGPGQLAVDEQIKASHVNCSLTGSGTVSAQGISAETVSATLRGAGEIRLQGRSTESAAIVVKGSGTVDVGGLSTPAINASAFGTGIIEYNKSTRNVKTGGNINQIQIKR